MTTFNALCSQSKAWIEYDGNQFIWTNLKDTLATHLTIMLIVCKPRISSVCLFSRVNGEGVRAHARRRGCPLPSDGAVSLPAIRRKVPKDTPRPAAFHPSMAVKNCNQGRHPCPPLRGLSTEVSKNSATTLSRTLAWQKY